jgi:Tol biopolymer transport system component
MKSLLILLLFSIHSILAQPNLDIYVLDFTLSGEIMNITSVENISNNPGYDSQPFFTDNSQLLYAGAQNGQTDIMRYHLKTRTTSVLDINTTGGAYSPQQFPTSNEIAAVRLDSSGLQRLYAYNTTANNQESSRRLLEHLEVAYFAFHDNDRIVASILGANQLNLVVANLKTKKVTPYIENAGRSIHKVPQSTSVSYTLSNEDKNMDVYILDLDQGGESFFVCQLPVGVQDHCWINNSQLLLGSGSKIYLYDMFGAQEWIKVADLSTYTISTINRITVSPDGKKIALVANDAQ